MMFDVYGFWYGQCQFVVVGCCYVGEGDIGVVVGWFDQFYVRFQNVVFFSILDYIGVDMVFYVKVWVMRFYFCQDMVIIDVVQLYQWCMIDSQGVVFKNFIYGLFLIV